jgi:pimeloyl-ACP methyl ester carboxylesterase
MVQTPYQHGFVATPSGRIHYLEAGGAAAGGGEAGGRPTLVLLHSNGCSAHEFLPCLDVLAAKFRVILWDQPGHGDSDPLARHFSIEDYTAALMQFLDALGLARVALGGSSVGGLITLCAGALHPERFSQLLIIEAPLNTRESWAANWSMVEGLFSVPTQSYEQAAPRFRALSPEFHSRWNMDRNKAGGWTMMDVMWGIRDFDCKGMLARVGRPALVLVGDQGPVMPTLAEYRRILPGAAIRIMPGCGHFPMIDAPEEFAGHIVDFLADLFRTDEFRTA